MIKVLSKLRQRLRSKRQYYSPIVNPYDLRVQRILNEHGTAELANQGDLPIDTSVLTAAFGYIAAAYKELPFPEQPDNSFRYCYENPAFSYGDAIVLFGMIRHHRPCRIVEVGSGYSSCLMMDTNDLFFNGSIALTFIDPYPETLERLLGQKDLGYKSRIRRQALQDVPIDVFCELRAGDILFLDSSHVSKLGSDVNDYFFRILPALRSGVMIHIHDIPYPFDYPPEWVIREQRSWNEAYMLRAFLQYNTKFKIEYFNHYMYRMFPDLLRAQTPLCLKNCGASIWIKKISE